MIPGQELGPSRSSKPARNAVINKQARRLVYNVYSFMKKEAEAGLTQTKLEDVYKRTAEATNTSLSTVIQVLNQAKDPEFLAADRIPSACSRIKRKEGLDTLNEDIIKRSIHNFHVQCNELPTNEKLRTKLWDEMNINSSRQKIKQIVKGFGFQLKKTEKNEKVLIEKYNVRLQRIEYLKKITKYLQEGRHIIYTLEKYFDPDDKNRLVTSKKGVKRPIAKTQRIVILQAASVAELIPKTLLIVKACYQSGLTISYEKYEKWLRTQLMPNIPQNSVVIIGNMSFHNKQYDPAPAANARTVDMHSWLTKKGIQYSDHMLKPVLYNLIKTHRDKFKQFCIDRLLNEHGHTVLRLPIHHLDLSPTEMVWPTIKQALSSKSENFNIKHLTDLVREELSSIDLEQWDNFCKRVDIFEEQYRQSDQIVEILTEEIAFRNDSDDSESDSDDDSYDSGDENEAVNSDIVLGQGQ